jgi:hypothetical protein
VSSAPDRIATFHAGVSCRRDANSPLGLTLIGRTTDHPEETVSLSFSLACSLAFDGAVPEDLPEVLEATTVERIDAHQYRISSPPREWIIQAAGVHLHREIATTFYRAIPPRVPPWSKRLFWKLVLAMAASPAGKQVLVALRRR